MDAEELDECITDGERDYARMPFELRALEAALDIVRRPPRPKVLLADLRDLPCTCVPTRADMAACRLWQACQHVEQQATTLEASATPLLQTTTASKVGQCSSRTLEMLTCKASPRPACLLLSPGDQRLPGAAAPDEGAHERAEDQGGDGAHGITRSQAMRLLQRRQQCLGTRHDPCASVWAMVADEGGAGEVSGGRGRHAGHEPHSQVGADVHLLQLPCPSAANTLHSASCPYSCILPLGQCTWERPHDLLGCVPK